MGYLQNYPQERTVYLTLADVPATDVLHTDLTVRYKKSGMPIPVVKVLSASDWINLGGGMYTIKWSSSEMDTLGNFFFTVEGVEFDNLVYDEFQIEPASTGGSGSVTPVVQTCVLSGHVSNIGGDSDRFYVVIIKPIEFPSRYGAAVIAADPIKTVTDAYGNWSVSLVRNSVVMVIIERAAIRHQVKIPDAPTANFLSLVPPFNIDYTMP